MDWTYCLFALNIFLIVPAPCEMEKTNFPWWDYSNAPSFVLNKLKLVKILKFDQDQKWVLTAKT